MSRRNALVIVLLVLTVVGSALVLGVLDRPTVTGTESRFVGVNASTTVVETDLRVRNPNPVGVRLGGVTVNHTVSMNGIVMGTGTTDGLDIAEDNSTVTLTTGIDNRKIPAWWATHVRNGERTRVDTTARVRTSLFGRVVTIEKTNTTETHVVEGFNSSEPRPIHADLPLISDPVLVVERTNATWGTVTRERTPLESEFVVSNPKPVPFVITRIDYEVTMNGVAVGNGTTGREYTVPADGRRTIRAAAVIENDRLDEWWVTHLQRNQRTDLRVAFTVVVELPNGDTVRIPLDGLDYRTEIETDVLGTKHDSTG